ncbi:MAG: 3-methyl-2-oxobutanoate dehydrogenase subunit VorB [Deltaproteobacteria bacterium]|nr:3-methyl-2-oxobutanoate dehydrogenase subunit VorB [Deltaproteobacteria bacterium]
MAKVLMKGNEAIGEAAIRAGCIHFFGYPITPQSEVPEYLARRLPEVGGQYVQAESEVAASNMIYGAAGVGMRVLTTSSSPGISLMAEGISYIAASELPVVLVNIMRAGPGLGGILPAQGDYFQATRGTGHGDFQLLVLAPASVQEAVNLVILAFELAEKYLNPVMVIGDGMIGQMMEPVEFPVEGVGPPLDPGDWALTGCEGRERRIVNSLFLDPEACNRHNLKLKAKYERMAENEQRWELYNCDEPYDLLVTAFGMMSRICKTAIDDLKAEGTNVGLFRPISLNPFPYEPCRRVIDRAQRILDVEMSMGQMIYDIQLAAQGRLEIDFHGTAGGVVPSPDEVADKIRESLARIGRSPARKPGKRSAKAAAAQKSKSKRSKKTATAQKPGKRGGKKPQNAGKRSAARQSSARRHGRRSGR